MDLRCVRCPDAGQFSLKFFRNTLTTPLPSVNDNGRTWPATTPPGLETHFNRRDECRTQTPFVALSIDEELRRAV